MANLSDSTHIRVFQVGSSTPPENLAKLKKFPSAEYCLDTTRLEDVKGKHFMIGKNRGQETLFVLIYQGRGSVLRDAYPLDEWDDEGSYSLCQKKAS